MICEGVKQIRGAVVEEKNFFIPLAGWNDLHTFTFGLDTPLHRYPTNVYKFKNDGFLAIFAQNRAFLRRCELPLFTVVLFLLREMDSYAKFVKVAESFASLCEGRPSQKIKYSCPFGKDA